MRWAEHCFYKDGGREVRGYSLKKEAAGELFVKAHKRDEGKDLCKIAQNKNKPVYEWPEGFFFFSFYLSQHKR